MYCSYEFSLVDEYGRMDEVKAMKFETMCDLITTTKRQKRTKGSRVGSNLESNIVDALKAISEFFCDIRKQFFHRDFPKNGTKIKDMETTVPEQIREASNDCPTDIICRLIAGCLHRLVFDDRDRIMGKKLLTCERKFHIRHHPM